MWNQELVDRELGYFNDIIYLNVASISMPPVSVQKALASYYQDFVISKHGVHSMLDGYEMANQTRALLAELIHADPSEIAYVQNTNAGMDLAASGYAWKAGDNIIITDVEQQSNCYLWKYLERFGVELRVVASDDGGFFVEDFLPLMDENTRMVALSAVPYLTGFFADLESIGAECRKRNILFAVDAIQAMGRMKIDVKKMKIDVLSSSCHKGMMTTFGVGFAYIRKEIMPLLNPSRVSMQSVATQIPSKDIGKPGISFDWFPDARRYEAGSLPQAGIYALSKAVSLLLELGPLEIQQRVLHLESLLRSALEEKGFCNFHIMSRYRDQNRSGNIIIQYDPKHFDKVAKILDKYQIYATSMPGTLRLSIGFYNTEQQMEVTAKALKEIDDAMKA